MSKNSCDWQPDSTGGFSCEWQPDQQQARSEENSSALYKFKDNFSWEGITTEAYKPEGASFANILRNVIIGGHGESCLFDLRYFEVEKGGYSSLEKHGHEHVVICVRGKGKAVVGARAYDLGFLDTIYIGPNDPHQLLNGGEEPFGFFCIVNSDRDRPAELLEEELKWLQETSETKNVIKLS